MNHAFDNIHGSAGRRTRSEGVRPEVACLRGVEMTSGLVAVIAALVAIGCASYHDKPSKDAPRCRVASTMDLESVFDASRFDVELDSEPMKCLTRVVPMHRIVIAPELSDRRVSIRVANVTLRQLVEMICRDVDCYAVSDPGGEVVYLCNKSAVDHAAEIGKAVSSMKGDLVAIRDRDCGVPDIRSAVRYLMNVIKHASNWCGVSDIVVQEPLPQGYQDLLRQRWFYVDGVSPRAVFWLHAMIWRANLRVADGVLYVSWAPMRNEARRRASGSSILSLAYSEEMKVRELAKAEALIRENAALIRSRWHEVFGF